MDVDVVYTWVDGADPVWLARKAAALLGAGRVPPAADHAARFRDAGEIRHSIASVLMYAPWVRRIFIVTDDQRPVWLHEYGERVTLVDYREIFSNAEWLPCYAARGIESQLHHIPGLADHYLYFNDDMFLGRQVKPGTFFDRHGRPRVFTATRRGRAKPWHGRPDAIPAGLDLLHSASVERSRLLTQQATGVRVAYDVRHQVKAISRPLMVDLERRFQQEFDRAASTRFRSVDTINPVYLHAFYGLATGAARAHYVRSIRERRSWKDVLIKAFNFDDSCFVNLDHTVDEARMSRVECARPKFICLNQTSGSTDASLALLSRLMERMWPTSELHARRSHPVRTAL